MQRLFKMTFAYIAKRTNHVAPNVDFHGDKREIGTVRFRTKPEAPRQKEISNERFAQKLSDLLGRLTIKSYLANRIEKVYALTRITIFTFFTKLPIMRTLLLAAAIATTMTASFVSERVQAQDIIPNPVWSQDFEGQTGAVLPAGWDTTPSPTYAGWTVGTATSMQSQYNNFSGRTGRFAGFNDDKNGSSSSTGPLVNDRITTDSINLAGTTAPWLVFESWYNPAGTSNTNRDWSIVDISTDGGATWTAIDSVPAFAAWVTTFVNLSNYAGQNVMLGFRFRDQVPTWGYGLGIDDLEIGDLNAFNLEAINIDGFKYYGTGQQGPVKFAVRNLGSTTVNSFTLTHTVNGSIQPAQTVNIPGGLATGNAFEGVVNVTPVAGNNVIDVWSGNINGSNADAVVSNDSLDITTAAGPVTPRKGLWEHFTQASCPPCAFYNPQLQPIADATANLVAIKYQTSWPGFDPMNNHNKPDVAARVTYYDISGVPDAVVNGLNTDLNFLISGSGFADAVAAPTPFSLAISAPKVYNNSVEATVDLGLLADRAILGTGTYRLRAALIEKTISFSTAPGSNGETVFHSVMKKMIPNPTGTQINITTTGQTQQVQLIANFTPGNVYDMNELRLVAWIQNDGDDVVWNAAESGALAAGVRDPQLLDANLNAYPNPANESAFINFNEVKENMTLRLTDAAGRTVYTRTVNAGTGVIEVPTASLPNGIYAYSLVSANGQALATNRVVVAH